MVRLINKKKEAQTINCIPDCHKYWQTQHFSEESKMIIDTDHNTHQ